MSLITETHDSLPYIDTPSSASLASARTLISASVTSTTTFHPLLPPLPQSTTTSALQTHQPPQPLSAISTTHYESPSTFSEARISSFYLAKRQQALELLDQFGKNSWLVHNSYLEDELRAVEKELEGVREEVTRVNRERKGVQTGRKGEMEGLERAWREGVGRKLEVQVALGDMEGERISLLREGAR